MKIVTFDYTDLKGNSSYRELAVELEPTDKFCGYDIGELDDEQVAHFVNEYDELREVFRQNVFNLANKYELKYKYRTFFEKSMANLIIEDI